MPGLSAGVTRAALALALLAVPAAAQQAANRVDADQDWSLFREAGPLACLAVSGPLAQAATRDGAPVQAQRGPAELSVMHSPEQGVAGQVSFTGGYPFAPGSTVSLEVSGTGFVLFTEGEWAYAATPQEDARIVAALKGGAEAVVTGRSGRGTVTRDTFSLLGFTAMAEAAARCG